MAALWRWLSGASGHDFFAYFIILFFFMPSLSLSAATYAAGIFLAGAGGAWLQSVSSVD